MGNQAHGHSRNCLNSAWRTRLQGGPRKGCPSLQKKGLKEGTPSVASFFFSVCDVVCYTFITRQVLRDM